MRVNHPDAGRYDSAHPDDEPRGPTVRDLEEAASRSTLAARLDDECDRLTEERDALAAVLKLIADGEVMSGTYSHADTVHKYQRIARAALAKLEDESDNELRNRAAEDQDDEAQAAHEQRLLDQEES